MSTPKRTAGSHDEVAERLIEYHGLGFDEFILSGYPYLEEAYWSAEDVMPRLRDRGLIEAEDTAPVAASTFR